MQTIRWGIIGCGDVTEIKSGPGFQLAAGSELVAVMRRDAAKAQDYARRHGVKRWYADADDLIADPEVTAIYVATPPASHEEYALRACAAGKACYVEKPMSRNAAEAGRMVDAFDRADLPLFVAYYRRALPRFMKIKSLLDEEALGAIQTIDYRYADGQMRSVASPLPWRLSPELAGGGLFFDLGSHALDLLDWFFGPLANVRGKASARNGRAPEDRVELTFDAQDGIAGKAEWDFRQETRADEFTITGEKATARVSCFGPEPVRLTHADGRQEQFDLPNPKHVQQPLIQIIVDRLLGGSTRPDAATPAAALRTQEIMDIAVQEFYGGRADGFWAKKT